MKKTAEGSLKSLYFILPLVIVVLAWLAYLQRPLNCQSILRGSCLVNADSGQVLGTSRENNSVQVENNESAATIKTLPESSVDLRPIKPNYGYHLGIGEASSVNEPTELLLRNLGYSSNLLWQAGIKIIAHDGPIPLHCSPKGTTSAQGIAVKSNQNYLMCGDGNEMIDESYKTPGMCTVVYNWQNYRLDSIATGNSQAILAHEIGHCLHFIYGENRGLNDEYQQLRPKLKTASLTETEEIIANDFMICKTQSDTSWGADSYYRLYGFEKPSKDICARANQIFDSYYPL